MGAIEGTSCCNVLLLRCTDWSASGAMNFNELNRFMGIHRVKESIG